MKRCSKCRANKPESEFHKNSAQRDGLANYCRPCFAESNRISKKKNIERVRAEKRRYFANHPERRAANEKAYRARRKLLFPGEDAARALARYHMNNPRQPCVYLVGVEPFDVGPVKIGHTINLPVRLVMLQNGSPLPLAVAYVWQFDTKALAHTHEHLLRSQFKSCRIHGEWFRPDVAMSEWIRGIIATQPDIET